MRYRLPNCPTCGRDVDGEADYVPGRALVTRLTDGSYEYDGETDMFWDGQMNELEIERLHGFTKSPATNVRVECRAAHTWETERYDE